MIAIFAAALAAMPPIAFLSMGYSEVVGLGADCDLNGDGQADFIRLLDGPRDVRAVAVIVTEKVDTHVVATFAKSALTGLRLTPVTLGGETRCNAFRLQGRIYYYLDGEIVSA